MLTFSNDIEKEGQDVTKMTTIKSSFTYCQIENTNFKHNV